MSTERVVVHVDGKPVEVSVHDSAAAAAIRAEIGFTRTSPITAEKRAAYCMMGICFECLMVIDGVPSRHACMVPVKAGMRIERQLGGRDLA